MHLKSLLLALGLALTGHSGSAPAQDPPVADGRSVLEWRQQAGQAYRRGDYPAFLEAVARLHDLRPYNGDYMYQLVLANALVKDRSAAYSTMLQMQQQGLAYDFDENPDSEFIRGTQVYDYLNELMKMAGEPAGASESLFELPEELVLPAAMTWDPGRQALLIGTARTGSVYAVNLQGEAQELLRADAENGLWGIYGLLVDGENNRLWISIGANALFSGFDPADAGRSALLEYTLDTLEPVRRYPVPVDGNSHRLGDIARAPSGDLYVADGAVPVVYRLKAGEERLQAFVASPQLVSLRGLEMSPGGELLYVADHEMGLMYVDLAQTSAGVVSGPENLNLGGIEGLAHWDGHLVVVQSGIRPQRVMRLELGGDGRTIAKVAPLAVAQPHFDYPTQAVTVSDRLYFLANSHWGENMVDPQPVHVAVTGIAEAPNLVPPDMQKFRKEREAARAKRRDEPPDDSN